MILETRAQYLVLIKKLYVWYSVGVDHTHKIQFQSCYSNMILADSLLLCFFFHRNNEASVKVVLFI